MVRAWRELDRAWLLLNDKGWFIKETYDFEDIVIKYEDGWWDDDIFKTTLKLSKLFPEKLIIGIFDTDFEKKYNWSDKKLLNLNYELLQEKYFKKIHENKNRELDNSYVLFLHTPDFRKNTLYNDNLCIEFFYDDEVLKVDNLKGKIFIWKQNIYLESL